ncbi:MAG: DUF2779 domain-containing protein [Acidobacteria bacterium]|nr:DUF2779 domain-containing protein [Acidobacteriota bacterium]
MPRYFTKSKFKLALECPTKLFYTGKSAYVNQRVEDTFLAALADGGFQVGALARCYYPEGIRIETPNDEVAIELTNDYLKADQITLFEAGFCYGTLLIRTDIVIKNGNVIDLYEVKAKSCDFDDEAAMLNKDGSISSKWKEYIEDVAFQKHVIQLAYPDLDVRAHLMLTDKTVRCGTDGLNQKFRLVRDVDGRRKIEASADLTDEDLATRLLRSINVDGCCEKIFASEVGGLTFEGVVNAYADHYDRDIKLLTDPHPGCKDCEFTHAEVAADDEPRSGYHECWGERLGWNDEDFEIPNAFDLWYGDKKRIVKEQRFKMSDLDEAFIKPKTDDKAGLSRTERQWLQISKVQNRDSAIWLDRDNLRREIDSWSFPLHFIDFEGSKPVIPFLRGRRPYEDIAFQFSHHTVDANGVVSHVGEYLNATPGSFPNYDFVRALKAELANDEGTIFRYHSYENTMLCAIYSQLMAEAPEVIPDRDELCDFIKLITQPTGKLEGEWAPGPRNMVDLHYIVTRYYYDPATNGSISIKYVLPATINSSNFLKEKYSQPVYGSIHGIQSRNFGEQIWVVDDGNGKFRDPYKLLPPLFTDESAEDYAAIMAMDKINDGGAAMTAYGKLQFEDIPAEARAAVESALLKYCELDTLAMVMIYEAWRDAI